MPKTELPAHLHIAQFALKHAQKSLQKNTKKNIRAGVTSAPERLGKKGGGIAQAALLYGVGRMATRSVPGMLLVGGGYLAKKWLDQRQIDAEPADTEKNAD